MGQALAKYVTASEPSFPPTSMCPKPLVGWGWDEENHVCLAKAHWKYSFWVRGWVPCWQSKASNQVGFTLQQNPASGCTVVVPISTQQWQAVLHSHVCLTVFVRGSPCILVIREAALAADLLRRLIFQHLAQNLSTQAASKAGFCLIWLL